MYVVGQNYAKAAYFSLVGSLFPNLFLRSASYSVYEPANQ